MSRPSSPPPSMDPGSSSKTRVNAAASKRARRRARLLLLVGMLAGIVAAASGIIERQPTEELDEQTAALVNGQPIGRAALERALRRLSADRRERTLDAAMRRRVLDKLIDEELLVQHGLEMGLATRDRRVRAELSAAVIGMLTARGEDESREPSEQQLRAFYDEHRDYFRRGTAVRIEHLFFRADGPGQENAALERATEARRQLTHQGVSLRALREQADEPGVDVGEGWLLLSKLRDYLGPTVTRAVATLSAGELSEPIRSRYGYHLVRVAARRLGLPPPFESIRSEVRAELTRRAGEEQLRRFLGERRQAADIRIAAVQP